MYTLTTGVELELWVIDETGRLCDGTEITDAHRRIEPEFIDPLIEVKTSPHTSEADLQSDLQSTLQTAIQAAAAVDKRLVPFGTPLTASDATANCERGEVFETVYGSGVESAKNCAGTHIHFEQGEVVDQLNVLTALDPALALVSSSAYYSGRRGASSSRALAYRTECGTEFRCFTDLCAYADSLAGWRARVDAKFDRFKRLAAENGVSPERIETLFSPEDTVLNPVRLRECQPTVEWRAPDATLPSQIVQLVTDVEELVAQTETTAVAHGTPKIEGDSIQLPEFETLRDISWQAIKFGLESRAVRSYLRDIGFTISAYEPLSRRDGPKRLSDSDARRRRLRQAGRLEADVQQLSRKHPTQSTFPA